MNKREILVGMFLFFSPALSRANTLSIVRCSELTSAERDQVGQQCKTSKGAVFTRVAYGNFGNAWRDPGDAKAKFGRTWSKYIGDFENYAISPDDVTNSKVVDSPATEACRRAGGTLDSELPTDGDYVGLTNFFEYDLNHRTPGTNLTYLTEQGRRDLNGIFPDMKGHWFWTSSVYSEYINIANEFNSAGGTIIMNADDWRNTLVSVRCVHVETLSGSQ